MTPSKNLRQVLVRMIQTGAASSETFHVYAIKTVWTTAQLIHPAFGNAEIRQITQFSTFFLSCAVLFVASSLKSRTAETKQESLIEGFRLVEVASVSDAMEQL